MSDSHSSPTGLEIAIVALAGRFPGAEDVEAFWRNLLDGVESISRFDADDLVAEGLDPALLEDPDYVPAGGVLDGAEDFDAAFFGYTPREAEILDPQQRLFLELAWEALERAGYDAEQYERLIGVYAGAKFNHYIFNLQSHPRLIEEVGVYQAMVASDKDYLPTRVSYKLGLTGPSIGVQTACSTTLVAVHLACQGLLAGECDLALAGGVSLSLPQRAGYRYTEGAIMSPDGRCRPFDAAAGGTVGGSGLGIVVLKRLADALEDGDRIRAVIRGSAINNDGSNKVGFTAPSVDGQAKVLRAALELAEVEPETVTYVETHGTGTALGDPVEIAALAQAFRRGATGRRFCGLGSVKSNIGHLDPAAGIAGLIKATLAVERGELPPTLHFERPNPNLGLEESPFYVVAERSDWRPPAGVPRRAGVSSFGIGGTNVHAVLEEPPATSSGPSRRRQLLLLSARTATALEAATDRLAADLQQLAGRPDEAQELADTAFTLQLGRRRFEHRRMVVASDAAEAARLLAERDGERVLGRRQERLDRPLVFLFPGQGAQYPGMGHELYAGEAVFRDTVDRAVEILAPELGKDLRPLLYPRPSERRQAGRELRSTAHAQPALFTVELAMARLFMSWGIEPETMVGHSIGEYVAAHLAGVLSFEDALRLVAARARLMQELPGGAMLGVSLAEDELRALAGLEDGDDGEVSLAAVNGPRDAVVAGPETAVARLEAELAGRGVPHRRLHTSHAFHSPMMEPALEPFAEALSRVRLEAPQRPYFSNLSGRPITAEEATDPQYWLRHLRHTVRFGPALDRLWEEPNRIFLEVGPGRALSTLARRHPARARGGLVVASLPAPPRDDAEPASDLEAALTALGRLWMGGVQPDWQGFYRDEKRRRRELPTYPFERRRYWLARRPQRLADVEPADDQPMAGPPPEPEIAPAVESSRPELETAYLAPRDEVETRVAEVWQRLLGVEPIGVHDNFFELGGGSLLATQLTARLRAALGVELALGELLEHPTVAGVAERLAARRGAEADSETRTELPQIVGDAERLHQPFPLTEVQQAYWIGRGEGLDLGNVSTHYYIEYEIDGLDLERFERALQRTIERQHMLRAIILADGRQQILESVPPYRIAVLDLSERSPQQSEAEAEALRRRMSHQVLASDRWPLFEVAASRFAGGRVRLHFSFDFLLGDAWSLQLLLAEIGRFYLAPEAAVEALEISFRDYVLAEEELRAGELYRRSLEYWRQRLPTLPSGPELPLARSLGEIDRPRFVRRASRLDAATWQRLKQRGARAGLTASAVLAAAFAEVLARWSAHPRFTLSLTLFNRQPFHPEVDELIGDFTSLVLLESDGRGADFEARARRLQKRLWRDLDHRFLSGVGVVRELTRAQGRTGGMNLPVVFTSLLGLDPTAAGGGGEGFGQDIEAREVYSISQTPQVLLDHQVGESPAGLSFNWDVVDQAFPEGLIDDLFAAYCRLIERLADDDGAWTATSSRALPAAQQELIRRAASSSPAVSGETLPQLFSRQLERRGDAIAVVDGDRALSYRALAQHAGAIAATLRQRGVGPESRVAVVLEKGWRQAVATLAVVEAGAAYLPADAGLPGERLAYLLEQGGVEVVLAAAGDRRSWGDGVEVLAVEADPAATARGAVAGRGAEPRNLAYVIFTSGSTGWPKGVAIEHRAAANTLVDVDQRFAIGDGDRVLALSALGFDLSVYDLFGIWAAGGCAVFPPPWTVPDPETWIDIAERGRVTVWNSVPALLEMVVETAAAGRGLAAPLRRVLLSGDWIPVRLPARLGELVPGAEVISLGGATEAAIWSILHPVEPGDAGRKSIPYGRSMAGQSFHVLDERLAERPLWVPGDLFIGGAGLARCYWRSPRQTAWAFIPDPGVGPELDGPQGAGARLYRTGDRGRLLPDGEIEFLGREDHQIKIRGHRIELGEIETVLMRHPAVESAVAAAVGERQDRRLVAWYVPRQESGLGAAALETHLRASLPDYMVPKTWVALAELPLNVNGKVDRGRLCREIELERDEAEGEAPAASSPVEDLLCTLCAEVLALERVRPGDNFFSLGGHSLLATKLLARLREALGVELPLRQIFEEPEIGALARAAESARRRQASVEMPPIEPLPRDGRELPLSFPQQRLFFLKQLAPASPLYNVHLGVRLSGRLGVPVLRHSLDEIARRHEALRTLFVAERGKPTQIVVPPQPMPLPLVDLRALVEDDRQAAAERWLERDLATPFDLARPLWRTRLFRLRDDDHLLFFMTHHIVWDDWSEGLFWRELGVLYGAFAAGRPSPLPALEIQYADYAAWQRDWLEGPLRQRQLDYWQQQLGDAPRILELPLDRPRPAQQSFRGSTVTLWLETDLARRIEVFAREHGATLYMVLLAAFQSLLHRATGQRDLVTGTLTGNRGRPETEGLIGFFINTLALRLRLDEIPTFAELVRSVRGIALDAYDHQDLPFEQLIEELRLPRDLGYNPMTQVVFNLFTAERGSAELPGLTFEPVSKDPGWAPFDLALTVLGNPGGMSCEFQYATDLFDRTTVTRLARRFRRLVIAALEQPSTAIDALDTLAAAERQQLVFEWNDTRSPYPRELPVHRVFEQIAAERPQATALEQEGEIWTYERLEADAGRLAAHLRRRGVSADARVGLLVERSARAVVAILAILKAGGAYVPFDLSYPEARLRFMIDDAAPQLIVTEEASAALLAAVATPLVSLDRDAEQIAAEPAAHGVDLDPQALAYVMYTSGSTGTPKGVQICHRAVVRLVREVDYADLVTRRTYLQMVALSFDAATFEIWAPLLNGGRLVVLGGRRPGLDEIAERIDSAGVDTLLMVSGLFHQLVEFRLEALAPIEQLMAGGDVLQPAAVRRVLERFPGLTLVNVYGPTENATFTSCYTMTSVADAHDPVPIGRPNANSRALVLDARLAPVPIGIAGDLYAAGDGVARGYHRRPRRTAERFIPDPSSVAEPGTRLYRIGDRARYLADGRIEFLGRLDGQVKVRGFRVELGEIESALAAHPELRGAAVILDRRGASERLVGFVVPAEGEDPPAGLADFLRQRLPEHEVPAVFVAVADLPLTANGKVDRRALAEVEIAGQDERHEQVAPRNETERLLAEIWSQVLRLESVGVHENFFRLGGDSILTIQIAARAHETGLEISPSQFFQHQTVAELAAVLGGGSALGSAREAPVGPLPLAPIQRWFFAQGYDRPEHFNHSLLVHAPEDVGAAWLRRAVGRLVEHHDALRLTFERGADRDGWRQIGHPAGGGRPAVAGIDLRALEPGAARQEVERGAATLQLGFDLGRGPLLRAAAFELGAGEPARFLFVVHHLVVDAVSWRLLLDQLHLLYRRRDEARPLLAPPAISYGGWVRQLAEQAAAGAFDQQLELWLENGRGPSAELPVDRPAGRDLAGLAARHVERFDEAVTQDLLQQAPARHGSGVERALLAALLRALARRGGTRWRLDLEAHGREELAAGGDPSRTVGWFTALYPVTLEVDPEAGREQALDAIDRGLEPFARHGRSHGALRYLSPDPEVRRALAELPAAAIGFNYLGRFEATLSSDAPFQPAPEPTGPTQDPAMPRPHPLEVAAAIADGRLEVSFEYPSERFDTATIEALGRDFSAELQQLLAGDAAAEEAEFTADELTPEELDNILSQLS